MKDFISFGMSSQMLDQIRVNGY